MDFRRVGRRLVTGEPSGDSNLWAEEQMERNCSEEVGGPAAQHAEETRGQTIAEGEPRACRHCLRQAAGAHRTPRLLRSHEQA